MFVKLYFIIKNKNYGLIHNLINYFIKTYIFKMMNNKRHLL